MAHPANAEEHKLVTYADIEAPQVVDIAPEGPSLGDMYMRHGVKRSAPGGPVIGRYFTQAIIVYHDPENAKVARSYFSEQILDDGSIYMTDMVETIHCHVSAVSAPVFVAAQTFRSEAGLPKTAFGIIDINI